MNLYNMYKNIKKNIMHKNLLRFYNKEKEYRIYFITAVVKDRIQFFDEKIFKEILKRNIEVSQCFHDFYLYSFTIEKDHVHFLIQPLKRSNISDIIKFIKQNFSQDINNLSANRIKQIVGENPHSRRIKDNVQDLVKLKYSVKQYSIIEKHKKYLYQLQKDWDLLTPYFKWQKSFHDHIIRNYKEFKIYSLYIKYNSKKHKMKEDI